MLLGKALRFDAKYSIREPFSMLPEKKSENLERIRVTHPIPDLV